MQIQSNRFWNKWKSSIGNASKDFLLVNVKKSGLFGYVNDFLVDYGSIGIDYILDIHEYLMEKHDIR